MDPIFSQLNKNALEKGGSSLGSSNSGNTNGAGSSSFQKVLDSQTGPSDDANAKLSEMVDNMFGVEPNNGIKANPAGDIQVDIAKAGDAVGSKPDSGMVVKMLEDLNKDQNQFDHLKEMLSSGRTFKPQELLSMQVGVQHLTLELELFSKGLEQVNRAIQQPIQMNFG